MNSSMNSSQAQGDKVKGLVKDAKLITIFIGNPGTGKSTLVNCYTGKALFTASASKDGHGITRVLDGVLDGDNLFMDTPGLSDMKLRKVAGQAIEAAWRCGGQFRIVFVLTTESGRLRPDDITTVKLVVEAANANVEQIMPNQYAILVNKCDVEWLDMMLPDDRVTWTANLMENFTATKLPTTTCVYCAPEIKALKCAKDKIEPLGEELRQWLDNLPVSKIDGPKVGKVNCEAFDETRMRCDELTKKYNEATARQVELIEDLRRQGDENRREREKAEAKRQKEREMEAEERRKEKLRLIAVEGRLHEVTELAKIEEEKRKKERDEEKRAAAARNDQQKKEANKALDEIVAQAKRLDNFCSSDTTTFDSVFKFACSKNIPNLGGLDRNPAIFGIVMMDPSTWSNLKSCMMQYADSKRR